MKFALTFFLLILTRLAFGLHANFNSDKTAGCPALVVNFTDASTDTVTSWAWDFGNGNFSNLQNPSATYLKPGNYTVKLVVQKGILADSTTKMITVYRLPIVNFTVDKPSACLYDIVNFKSDIIPGDAPITDYAWGLGDGIATSAKAPFYKYNTIGAYDITLVVQDSNKCSASKTIPDYIHVWGVPKAAYTASPTSSCQPTMLVKFTNQSTGTGLTYAWDLDGTGIITDTNTSHTYHQQKYKTSLTVTDVHGCVSSASQQISVAGLSADFVANKYLICTGQKIQFTNTSNFSGTNWAWDFGDGTTSKQQNPQKTYSSPGIFDVKFTIADGGCVDSTDKPKLINVKQGASLTNVSMSLDTTQACAPPLTVHFQNTTQGDIIGYLWDFGDGQNSTDSAGVTTYTGSGNYTITLTLMDTAGCISTGVFPNAISTSGPSAKFQFANNCPGVPIQFTNNSTKASSYHWDFGDGDTSALASPTHAYTHFGSYNVTLTSFSKLGCDKSTTQSIFIDTLHTSFAVDATYSPCPPFVALFQNQSQTTGLKYTWDFGDGYTDTTTNPTHIYFYPGVYSVKLIGASKTGCIDTLLTKDLITVQGPTATFTVNPTTGCTPLNVNFSAVPSANTKTIWSDLGDGTVISDTLVFSHVYNEERVYHPQFVLTDKVGCTVSYPIDSIVTHTPPSLQVNDTSICGGSSAYINLNSTGTIFKWSPPSFINCDTCKNVAITSPDTINYQVTAFNKFGCTSGTKNITVNVDPMPHLIDSIMVDLCTNDALPLYVGNKAVSINWSPLEFLSDSSSFNPICKPKVSVTYTVTGYNHLGCSVVSKAVVNVRSKVDVSLGKDLTVCPFDTVRLPITVNFASALGINYHWSHAEYLDSDTSSDPFVRMANKTEVFQLIATSGQCIADTENILVTVHPIPDLEVSGSVMTTPMAEVPLYAASHEDLTYTWLSKDSLSCTDCQKPSLYPTSSQVVYVQGKDGYGCVANDSVEIKVTGCSQEAIFLPNTFTPNGDGINDKLYIRTNALTSLSYFRIYDQWGSVVFETNHLAEGWDGNLNGKTEGTGVYVYVLEGKCQNGYDIIKSGNVTAIR